MDFVFAATAGFAGLTGIVNQAISKAASERGLETYRTIWLVELNYIGYISVLVMLIAIVVALLVAAGVSLHDWLQWPRLGKNIATTKRARNVSLPIERIQNLITANNSKKALFL